MTERYGLGRVPQFDPRSRLFAVSTPANKPPRSYTWHVGTHLDQGSEGACVGFAFAHELAARPRHVPGVATEHAIATYWAAQRIDPWEGGAYPGATPTYDGTSVLAGAKVMQAEGFYTGYRWAFDEHDMALVVGYLGPVVIGVNWYEGMFHPDADGFLHARGPLAGGHAILAHGISVRGDFYWLWNSWGPQWGNGGRAKISRETMRRLLAEQGEVCVPVRAPLRFQPRLQLALAA